MTGLSELLVEVGDNSCLEIFKRLELVREHYSSYVERVLDRKEIAARTLNITHYSNTLDKMMT
jgi:hypothetical protein